MRCLIRTIRRGGTVEGRVVEAPEISLGRAENQDIRLSSQRCALRHAVIARDEAGTIVIRSLAPTGVYHNGVMVELATLAPGDSIRIGGSAFSVTAAGENVDLSLEFDETRISRGNELEKALMERSRIEAPKPVVSMRTLAQILAGGILVLFLLIPLLGFLIKPLGVWFRTVPLLSDLSWSSGPIVPAHRFFADDCNRCHEKAFVSVENSACTACHKDTPHHVGADYDKPGEFEPTQCAACHKEHSDPQTFVRHDEALCTGCHADIKQQSAKTELRDVSGFTEGHPEFRAILPTYENGKESTIRVSMDEKAELREHSHLEFSHAGHLKKGGVKKPSGETVQLDCADCHRPEPGGALMAKVEFKTHCHDCHRLNFEADDPDREVPHGDDKALKAFLENYYADRALKGGYRHLSAPTSVQERRRPGVGLTPRQQLEAMEWVSRYSREVGTELIRYRLCATCHTVSESEAGGALPWKVEPLRVSSHWFPKARFSHDQHTTEKCTECHKVSDSRDSADVLLTGIATCRQCHGGADADNRLASTCIDCHDFHVSKTLSMDGKRLPDTSLPAGDRRKDQPRRVPPVGAMLQP